MYIANMNIKSSKKIYKKGDILGNEFSESDILRFIKNKIVFSMCKSSINDNYESKKIIFLNENNLKKIKTKSELIKYGKEIGFCISEELTREEIISNLLNYIEEQKNNE